MRFKTYLGTSAKLRNATMSVCQDAYNSASIRLIFTERKFQDFSKICRENSEFINV